MSLGSSRSISSEDGDKAVFFNGVLIAYYNAATDEPNVLSFVESVADNLSSASGANIKKAKIDKAPDFVHWEQSKQVENILWPNKQLNLLFLIFFSNRAEFSTINIHNSLSLDR